jgi:hypothetical protein
VGSGIETDEPAFGGGWHSRPDPKFELGFEFFFKGIDLVQKQIFPTPKIWEQKLGDMI